MAITSPTIRIDPARVIDEVDPRIYSGFTEHMGRCIYGGIYDPENKNGLADEKTGFRKDVMDALKALKIPVVRYPGGNFVSTYRWQDGVGPRELRPRRPELAWLTEESNQFGTGVAHLNRFEAISSNTYYANLRKKNGHQEPYGVKYWALGNEVWGPWQVGQMESQDYAKKAFQWAKALRLLDPTIKLISCGETGFADWDRVTLRKLAPVVDFHSIHLYTVSEGKHLVNVMGPAAAEKGLEITRSLIDLAKIEGGLRKDLTVCFDEWNVWDPVRAPGEKGAEEHYDLSDALAVASWLNVFVRKADIVKIACIAQLLRLPVVFSNRRASLCILVIVVLIFPSFSQTTYYPLQLFSNLMRGSSLSVHVDNPASTLTYAGPTVPKFVQDLNISTPDSAKLTKFVDVSAVLAITGQGKEIRIAIVNRSDDTDFKVPILFGPQVSVKEDFVVHEVWHEDLKASNGFDGEKVNTVIKNERFKGNYELKKHSFQILVFQVVE
ncbi:hypothetical protein CVT25_004416 [Psilocybe cyanescens]|uniref:non-reducing end alpha-L-arabinofuranosidase n=1 Tax=Psilocybe cyanescens TaxID=93625 RepID=A0A409XW08_PSICY|nr:hypothetical protein CVT25_004416 [Psilocybe cyanescens]